MVKLTDDTAVTPASVSAIDNCRGNETSVCSETLCILELLWLCNSKGCWAIARHKLIQAAKVGAEGFIRL